MPLPLGSVIVESEARVLQPVKIAMGESLSTEALLGGYNLKAILMPSAWTPADLTFQIAPQTKDGTFGDVHDDTGAEVTVTVATGTYVIAPVLRATPALKVRSGTSGVPVAQAADRTLILVLGTSTN